MVGNLRWVRGSSAKRANVPGSLRKLLRSPALELAVNLSNRKNIHSQKGANSGTSLVVQWLRILCAMQETWVQSLDGELRPHMPQGRGTKLHATATEPCVPEPSSHN